MFGSVHGNVLPANQIPADHLLQNQIPSVVVSYVHSIHCSESFPTSTRLFSSSSFLSSKTKSDRIKLTRFIGKDKFQMLLVLLRFLTFATWTCRNKIEVKDYLYQMALIILVHQYALLLLHSESSASSLIQVLLSKSI